MSDRPEVTSVAARDFWAYAGAAAIRLRWLRAILTVPALRGQPYTRLGPNGRWLVLPQGRVDLGRRGDFAAQFYVCAQGTLRIGDDFFANRNAFLSCLDSVTIGDRVRLGERVSIHDENHVFEPVDRDPLERRSRYTTAPVEIGDDVWLGANCVVLPGTRIGAGTVVVANSVVRGDLPAGVLAGGAPASVIRALRGA